ncbi:hypothetical protein GWI33_022935, partial [Rhynchophorus ferrugineus]
KKVELAKQSSKYIIKGALSPRLARKEVRKLDSFSNSDTKLNGSYLTVHGSTNSLNVPSISIPMGQNTDEVPPSPTPSQQWAEMSPRDVANWIDRKARIFFPLTFLIYNVLYWGFVYLL